MAHAIGSRSLIIEPCCWPDCTVIADHPDHPLCGEHYRVLGLMFIHEHIDVMRAIAGAPTINEMLERLVQEGRRDPVLADRRLLAEQRSAYNQAERAALGVVYYVRMGEFIKIGTTRDLPARLYALYLTERDVLATEPGGQEMELGRHHEFAEERVRRELFEPSDRLLAHIEALRSRHAGPTAIA